MFGSLNDTLLKQPYGRAYFENNLVTRVAPRADSRYNIVAPVANPRYNQYSWREALCLSPTRFAWRACLSSQQAPILITSGTRRGRAAAW